MRTPKQILEALAKIAPEIAITVHWSHDQDSRFSEIAGSVDGDSNDWQAWDTEVRATAVVDGKLAWGSAHLGGTWEKAGDNPRESNPDISGYLPQMIEEALEDEAILSPSLAIQIGNAQNYIRREMRARYDGKQGRKAVQP